MPRIIPDRSDTGDGDYTAPAAPVPVVPPAGGDTTGAGGGVVSPPGADIPVDDTATLGGGRRGGGGDPGYNPGSGPSYHLPGAPTFTPPTFARPTLADAYNEPGYQFRARAGEDALNRSAAARGVLRTGGTLKDIVEYGQNFAAQEYGQVYNRALSAYDRQYQGAHDAFAPRMAEYQTKSQAEIARANALYNQQWQAYQFAHQNRGGGGGSPTYYEPPPNPSTYVPGGVDPSAPVAPPGPSGGGGVNGGYNEASRDPYQYY